MGSFLEGLGAVVVSAVVAVGSAASTGCEIAASTACEAGKAIVEIAHGVADAADTKSSNDSKGNR